MRRTSNLNSPMAADGSIRPWLRTWRYFSRDAREVPPSQIEFSTAAGQERFRRALLELQSRSDVEANPESIAEAVTPSGLDPMELAKTRSGVAAWNDFSWVSTSARQALRQAAGITVPSREFVLWTLGVYLAATVPLNWLTFRLLGRVEWAWGAVPVLAVAWGGAVVWLTQLDIGFARAETEINVLELQNDYRRAHATRYTALYTALSTGYDIRFDDPLPLVQPFSAGGAALLPDQSTLIARLEGVDRRQLVDLPVSSNSTGMVHSEQYLDLGGGLLWHASA